MFLTGSSGWAGSKHTKQENPVDPVILSITIESHSLSSAETAASISPISECI